jgi:hypothetical protein
MKNAAKRAGTVATKRPLTAGSRMTSSTAILLVMGFLASAAWAIDTPNERITLVGLTSVHVVFDETGEEGKRHGVTRARLQPEVERELQRAGIRALAPAEALASAGRPTLHVRVSVLRVPDVTDFYVYSVDLALRQQVRLVRDRTVESYAVTWSENRVVGAARAGQLGVVRNVLMKKVDEFVAAWRVSNQERY